MANGNGRIDIDWKSIGVIAALLLSLGQGIYIFAAVRTSLEGHVEARGIHETQNAKTERVQRELDRALAPIRRDLDKVDEKIDRLLSRGQ